MKKEIMCFHSICLGDGNFNIIKNMSFRIFSGECFGIFGMSGFEQKEFMKLLAGKRRLSGGSILLAEKLSYRRVLPETPLSGIFFIDSAMPLVPDLTISDNFSLNSRKRNDLRMLMSINRDKKNRQHAEKVLKMLGIDIPVATPAKKLSKFQQYLVAVIYAWISQAHLVVISDILEFCSFEEADELCKIIKIIQRSGTSFLIITDNIYVIRRFCEKVLLFKGNASKLINVPELSQQDIACTVIKTEDFIRDKKENRIHLSVPIEFDILMDSDASSAAIKGYAGEIIGIFDSSMRLNQVIDRNGLKKPMGGKIAGQNFMAKDFHSAAKQKITFLAEPVPDNLIYKHRSFKDNICALAFERVSCIKGTCISAKKQKIIALDMEEEMKKKIKKENWYKNMSDLDKLQIIMARYFLMHPKILICLRPFLHLDREMRIRMYHFIKQIAYMGTMVLLISNDYSVMRPICDRFYRIKNGREILEWRKINDENMENNGNEGWIY